MSVIPIFSSHYSWGGRSILNLEIPNIEETNIDESKPVSIFSILKYHKLNDLYLADSSFSGLIEADQACKKIGANLHFGYKVICCADITDKNEKSFKTEHKIIIWLTNTKDYKNLVKIASVAQREGFYYIPRIDYKNLKDLWADGLHISIPFYDSFIDKNILAFNQCLPDFPCKPTLTIESNNIPFDSILENRVLDFAKTDDLEVVRTKSISYYKRDDYEAYMTGRCIHESSTMDKPELNHNSSNEFCFESAQESGIQIEKISTFTNLFKEYDLPFYGIRLPNVKIDEDIKNKLSLKSENNYEILRSLCREGFKHKIKEGEIFTEETEWFKNQVKHELNVLKTLGFVDYMLIVWDMINFCRRNDIPVGRGRGSSAGSAVAYLLGITDIPVKRFGLLFERFLSADRAATIEKDGITYLTDAPDIDTDISKDQRWKVVEYLSNKYPGQTSKILNIATLQGKNLIKDVARCVDDCDQFYLNKVTDLIPVEYGNVTDIQECYEGKKNSTGKWIRQPIEDFRKFCNEHPKIYKIALKLRNLARNRSLHASGLVICHCPIDEFIPTELSENKQTGKKQVASSFDMYSVGNIAIKLDLLGLKTLDILDNTAKLVGKKFDKIDINDTTIYKYLSNPESPFLGIFQAEDGLGEKTLRRVITSQNDTVDRIIDSITLGRPGAMDSIPDYCDFKEGNKFPEIDDKVKDILGPTQGLLLFQEQLMALSVRMANFSPNESNGIRKAVGKKDKVKMLSYKERFIERSIKNGYSEDYTNKTWDTFEASADYSFNKSHAASYAYNTATTAYFKANHTIEFFLSLLKYPPGTGDKKDNFIPTIKKELDIFGIKLLPPSLVLGNKDFTVENKNIRYGLNAIKGIAQAALDKLDNFKPLNCNKFEMFQASKQAGLSCGVMASLIMSGALDEFVDTNRSKLSFECLLFSKLKDKEKIYCINAIKQGKTDLIELIKNINEWTDSQGKKVARKTRLNTLRKDTAEYVKIYRNNTDSEDLCRWWYEKYLLGYSYSSSLKELFSKTSGRDDLITLKEFSDLEPNESGIVICQVGDAIASISKKGNKVMKLFVSDESNSTYFYFAGKSYLDYLDSGKPLPEADNIIAMKIMKSKDGGSGFVQNLKIQPCKIFTKLAEVKEKDGSIEENKEIPAVKEINNQSELALS